MNPYFAQIVVGMAAVLMLRGRLKALAVGFTHYTVQTLLIALAGDGAGTGATHLPLVLQLVFFPVTILPERYGIVIPFGPLLNSGLAGFAFFVLLRAHDRTLDTPDVRGAVPPTPTFFQDALTAVLSVALRHVAKRFERAGELPVAWRRLADNVGSGAVGVGDMKRSAVDWVHSLRTSTTEIQNIQNGTHYWVTVGKVLWGIWTITVAARGFLGTRRTIYSLCVVPQDSVGEAVGGSLQAALDGKRIKWVPVSSFTEEDERALQHVVLNIVQGAPRDQWDVLITRELHARLKAPAPVQAPTDTAPR